LTALDGIRKTILTTFGERSPEFRDNMSHAIYKGGCFVGAEDWEYQQCFAQGIPDTVALLEGLIRRLEEEKQDFVPPRPELADAQVAHRSSATTINIRGRVERLAMGDINEQHVSVVAVLTAIADGVEQSREIPTVEKARILTTLRDLARNPWIVSLGSGAILQLLRAALGGS
jgi:hypothetical protein